MKQLIVLFTCAALTTDYGFSPAALPLHPTTETQKVKRYLITNYGAVGDSTTLNTRAIQSAIDKCAASGGGMVVIPKGIFRSGSLFLKKGVNLEIQEGAVLKGSTDINDYPKINTRIEGHFEMWRAALINADGTDHLRITGTGTLDGSGAPFWKRFWDERARDGKTKNLDVERPRLMLVQNAKDVQISGIHFLNAGFWNLHIYKCSKVVVKNCSFIAPAVSKPDNHAPSSDGIDVDSSQDVLIAGCFFSVGDDCIALKGSKGPFALKDLSSPPVERITITDCIVEKGGGLVTCGSEATIVRDVVVKNSITRGPTVLRLKLRPDTPQQYENILLENITVENGGAIFKVSPWSQYFDLMGQEPPASTVRNVQIKNIHGNAQTWGELFGHARATITDIRVSDAKLQLAEPGLKLGNVEGLRSENVIVNGQQLQLAAFKQNVAIK
ncbi:Polygalacturonase [Chitinophaga jiangningensis]|uniref:Polygalacturonase n=1 Tax=Chitinophaga jiangningensis TaxID=1419482 RepID=A0A1M7LR23_9BACT|nr:glycosyl hydrolase family 28 protein [Chitinophaga jiangningensis]SHM80722.1 Polygalacturonase [Chitinophaga jiangningensis]